MKHLIILVMKKQRYSDWQIQNMLHQGLTSRKIRTFGISPKRITRGSRGLTINPVGHPQKFR